jgi:hypothetical protein
MNEWMNETMKEWTNKLMNEQIKEWMNEFNKVYCINQWINH